MLNKAGKGNTSSTTFSCFPPAEKGCADSRATEGFRDAVALRYTKDLKAPVVALSQLNRTLRTETASTAFDLRSPAQSMADADTSFLCWLTRLTELMKKPHAMHRPDKTLPTSLLQRTVQVL